MTKLDKAIIDYKALKSEVDIKKAEMKKIEEKMVVIETAVKDHLVQSGKSEYKKDGVGKAEIKKVLKFSIIPEKEDDAITFFKQFDGLVKESIHHKTFASFLGEHEEDRELALNTGLIKKDETFTIKIK